MEDRLAGKGAVRKPVTVIALAATSRPSQEEARSWVGKPGKDYLDARHQLSFDICLENEMGERKQVKAQPS